MEYAELRKFILNKASLLELEKETSFLNDEYVKIPTRQRLWHRENNNYSIQVCRKCCIKKVTWSEVTSTYRRYCSSKCAHNSEEVQSKTVATCIARFGETTNLKTADTKERIKQTNIERYGVDNPSKSCIVKERIKQTNIERYGVPHPSVLDTVKEKANETNFRKYGRKRQSQVHIPRDIIELKNNRDIMYEWHIKNKMPITEIAELLDVNLSQLCIHFRDNLNIPVTRQIVSGVEREVCAFLDLHTVEYHTSDRKLVKPKEIDIVIPSKKIGIEIDGLAWHSERRGKSKSYHVNKNNLAIAAGLQQLIHITDYEWRHKKDIVQSRILNKLGISSKIYARKCEIVQICSDDADRFLESNHIQGTCLSEIRIGLRYNGEICALMTFGVPRFNKKHNWELLRFASSKNITVIGGAGKLFKYFTTHNNGSIISYSDRRWNTGDLYRQLSFEHINTTSPNYWYTYKYSTFENRMQYQKHKLNKKLPIFDPALTEWDNMLVNGYDRYWDCGNDVWVRQ